MTRTGAPTVRVQGEVLHLLPERAILWENAETLLLADPHFGKAAAFRASGVPVPGGTTGSTLARLDRLLDSRSIRRIVFLGDLLHALEARSPATLATILAWRQNHPRLQLVLVRGNHDRAAGDPPRELGVFCVDAPVREGALAFSHYPTSLPATFVLAGHIHPAVRLVGRGRQRQTVPCFWFRRDSAVLPSFGEFTGSAVIEPMPDDRVFAVAGGEVVEVAPPG